MILIVDVETTGLPKKDLPKQHSDQPHILSAAWRVYDLEANIKAQAYTIVNPGVASLDEKAEKIHGITKDDVTTWGVPPIAFLHLFKSHLDSCKFLASYNLRFDKGMLERDSLAIGQEVRWLNRPRLVHIDLMQVAADIQGAAAGTWMKLEEAGKEAGFAFEGKAHNAMADLDMACTLFWRYVEREVVRLWA